MFTTKVEADIKLQAGLACAFYLCCWHGQNDFPFQLLYFLSSLPSLLIPQGDSSLDLVLLLRPPSTTQSAPGLKITRNAVEKIPPTTHSFSF